MRPRLESPPTVIAGTNLTLRHLPIAATHCENQIRSRSRAKPLAAAMATSKKFWLRKILVNLIHDQVPWGSTQGTHRDRCGYSCHPRTCPLLVARWCGAMARFLEPIALTATKPGPSQGNPRVRVVQARPSSTWWTQVKAYSPLPVRDCSPPFLSTILV